MTKITRVFLLLTSTSILRLRFIQRLIINIASSSLFITIIYLELSLEDLTLKRLLNSNSLIFSFEVNTAARILFTTILKLYYKDFFLCL